MADFQLRRLSLVERKKSSSSRDRPQPAVNNREAPVDRQRSEVLGGIPSGGQKPAVYSKTPSSSITVLVSFCGRASDATLIL